MPRKDAIQDFIQTYLDVLGWPPPRDIIRDYALLLDALYWGAKKVDDESVNRKKKAKGYQKDYWFSDWTLLETKAEVDRDLRAIASELRRWKRKGQGPGVQRPGPSRREDSQRSL